MNFTAMCCCGSVWHWAPLLLLKLMPLKSHPGAAARVRCWDGDGDVRLRWLQGLRGGSTAPHPAQCQPRSIAHSHHQQLGHSRAALYEGLSMVTFHSPHTPLLKCKNKKKKKEKNLNRVLFTLKTLSMICELSQPW